MEEDSEWYSAKPCFIAVAADFLFRGVLGSSTTDNVNFRLLGKFNHFING
jgi:hypothetical protein